MSNPYISLSVEEDGIYALTNDFENVRILTREQVEEIFEKYIKPQLKLLYKLP